MLLLLLLLLTGRLHTDGDLLLGWLGLGLLAALLASHANNIAISRSRVVVFRLRISDSCPPKAQRVRSRPPSSILLRFNNSYEASIRCNLPKHKNVPVVANVAWAGAPFN